MPDCRRHLAARSLHRRPERLGHEVYYIEDSARLPTIRKRLIPIDDYGYAGEILSMLGTRVRIRNAGGVIARATCRKIRPSGLAVKTIRQLYRDADAILNVCGSQEFNDDLLRSERILYIESDPGVEQIKVDQRKRSTHRLSARASRVLYFWRKCRHKEIPGSFARLNGFRRVSRS